MTHDFLFPAEIKIKNHWHSIPKLIIKSGIKLRHEKGRRPWEKKIESFCPWKRRFPPYASTSTCTRPRP
ncbi:MAG: hypothetical protein ACOC7W_09445, partial [Desulfosalsimonas sp.]